MALTYLGVGLNTFAEELKEGLCSRVDKFKEHLMKQHERDPEATSVKKKEEWMALYLDWCKRDRDVQNLIEQYLLDNLPE